MDNRMQLYSHIVLSGGCSMLSGLTERMSRDIRRLYLEKVLKVGHLFAYPCFERCRVSYCALTSQLPQAQN